MSAFGVNTGSKTTLPLIDGVITAHCSRPHNTVIRRCRLHTHGEVRHFGTG